MKNIRREQIMDLGAYGQIENLKSIAEANNIDIPRLRGYRLMKNERIITKDQIEEMMKDCELDIAEWLCETEPPFDNNCNSRCWCRETDIVKNYYLILNPNRNKEGENTYLGIRWDRIHGKKRKILKFEIKKQKKRIKQQFDTFNKYVGREDVLYIHSRMGGDNWRCYQKKHELITQPWFLERVDDSFDSTYCDFYAKIDITKTVNGDNDEKLDE